MLSLKKQPLYVGFLISAHIFLDRERKIRTATEPCGLIMSPEISNKTQEQIKSIYIY